MNHHEMAPYDAPAITERAAIDRPLVAIASGNVDANADT
jgi:hypothetical protein